MRLNQFLSSAGFCSRREADRLIEAGQVSVNELPAHKGMQIGPDDVVKVGDKRVTNRSRRITVAYYKPAGVTCTARDPHAKRTLTDAFSFPERLTYAGRLDRDSEGLLLMSNDGELIEAMMRGGAGHEKEYIVRVRSRIADAQVQTMRKGMWLRDLERKTLPCKVERLGERTFRIVLTQGLNRQIRRMCKALGNEVKILKRVRVLNVTLGAMKPGEQRILTGEELLKLYEMAGLPRPED